MNIPFFAINLEGDSGRWEDLSGNARSAGVDLRRVPAIDGRLIDPRDWIGLDVPAASRRNGREILPGEYGCYRSHILALEAFLADGCPFGVIVEDDIAIDHDTLQRVEAIVATLPDFDLIKLTNHRVKGFIRATETPLGDEIGRTLQGPQGSAAAYLVTRNGARELLSQLSTMSLPWDVAIERFWDSGLNVYSVRPNVLGLAPSSAVSTIVGPSGSYRAFRFPWWKRLSTANFRVSEQVRRLHHVLLPPSSEPGRPKPLSATVEGSLVAEALATLAILVMVSAVWRESAAYRYAGVLLVLFALIQWARKDIWTYSKPLIGGMGFLCLGWAIYVLDRLIFVYATTGQLGSEEGIYLFPALYATTGYAFLIYARRPGIAVLGFMILSAIFLVASTGYTEILLGERPEPFLFNNPIHAAIAAGMIFLCALQFASYTAHRDDLNATAKLPYWLLSSVVVVLSAINIVVLRSKGVWLALAIALILSALMTLARRSRRELQAAAGVLALLAVAVFASRNILWSTAGSTVTFAADFFSTFARHGWNAAIQPALTSHAIPISVQERLKLWADAVEIWARHPVFGAGSSWLTEWQNRAYHTEIYNIFHNGYLEIAVRYGIVGLAFYAGLFTWSSRQVLQAARAGLVAQSAWRCYISTLIFFAVTIFTNSNTRLAIGESYMWFAAAFGFYCFYLRQQAGMAAPRTYF